MSLTYQLNLATGVRSKANAYNGDRHSWNVNRDGSTMIQSVADPNDYDGEMYRIINMTNGQVLSEFKKKGPTLSSFTEPPFSPDRSLIAEPPTADRGLLI